LVTFLVPKLLLGNALLAKLSLAKSLGSQVQLGNQIKLTRLAQTMLLERMDLWALLGLPPPDNRQPVLFN
jgi:hypothetical protein